MEWKKAGIIILTIGGVFLTMKYLVPALLPFLLGILLALFVSPAAELLSDNQFCRKFHISKAGMGIFLILLLVACTSGILVKGVCRLSEWVGQCIRYYPVWNREIHGFVRQCCVQAENLVGVSAKKIDVYVWRYAGQMRNRFFMHQDGVDTAIYSVKQCVFVMGAIILMIVSAILFLQEKEKISKMIGRCEVLKKLQSVLVRLGKGIVVYLKAQIKIIGIIIILCTMGMYLMRYEKFWLWGLLIGLVDALPVLGTGTILIPGAIVLFVRKKTGYAIGFLLLYLVTCGVRQWLEPKMIGKKMGVSALAVLLSVYLGFWIFGSFGFIQGPLSVYFVYQILKEWKITE